MKRVLLSLFMLCFTSLAVADSDPEYEKDRIRHSKDYQTAFQNLKSKMFDAVNEHNAFEGLDRCVDNGKYANQFTIDRRCYMTDEQRQKHPYNAVVGIFLGRVPDYESFQKAQSGGTGVIIKNPYDGQLYIYTAAHCVSWAKVQVQHAYTQNDYVIPITNIVKQGGGIGNGNYEYLTKDHAIFAIPQEYQHILPYAETGEYTDNHVDVVGHGVLSILNDSAIHAAKQEWEKILRNPSGTQNTIFEKIKQYEDYTDLMPHDGKLKVSFNCELMKLNELNQSNTEGHNYCQGYGGDSGGPVFNSAGQVVGIVSWGKGNHTDDNRYAFFPYDGMKSTDIFNKDLQKYQKMSTKEPQNINNLKQIDDFNPHQKPNQ